jgi:hypothetical protein
VKLYVVENRTSKIILDVAEKRTGVVETMTVELGYKLWRTELVK